MAAPSAGTAFVDIQGDFSSLNKQIAARFSGKNWAKVGLLAGAGIAAGVGKGLYEIGEQFDDAYDRIRVETGKTGKQLGRLRKDFKGVVADVPADFESASKAVAGLSKRLNLTGRPLQRMSKQVLELSRLTETDLDTNIQAVTRTFGDWGVAVGKQPAALNKMFRASQATGVSVAQLGQEIVKYGAPLRQMGFGFDQAAGLIGKFEKEGVNAQLVMGSLRIALGKMAREGIEDPSRALQTLTERIEKAGSTGDANAIALEAFGARAGPDMAAAIREGRFELGDLFETIRSGRDTIMRSSRATEDFSEQWQRFKNRAMVQLEPVAKRVFGTISTEAGKVFDILTNPRLSNDEKMSRVFDRLSDLAAVALEETAEKAAEVAPRAASAFVQGFAGADAWGRLAIGALLLKKFGGKGAFRALGVTTGAAMGTGMAVGAAGGAAGVLARLKGPAMRTGAVAVGIAFADQLLSAADDRIKERSTDALEALDALADQTFWEGGLVEDVLGDTDETKRAKDLRDILGDIAKNGKAIDPTKARELRREIRQLSGASDEAKKGLRAIVNLGAERGHDMADAAHKVERMSDQFGSALRGLRIAGSKDMDKLVQNVMFGSKNMLRVGGRNSKATREEIGKQFDIARDRVRDAMRDKIISVEKGTERLKQLARKELGLYGISQGRVNVVLAKGANGELRPNQRGSYIDEGAPSGDSVPALLERGEYVLNREAVKKIGRRALDNINFSVAPRFQGGGIVELLHPFNDPAGHGRANSHLHIAKLQGIVELGRWLQKQGWLVGEHPAFGGVGGMHDPQGYHYTGQAIDVNWPDPSQEAAKIRVLLPLLGSGKIPLGREFREIARVVLQGPPSVALEAGQGALDRIRSAANERLREVAGTAGVAAGTGGTGAQLMRSIAAERGWNFADWWELDRRETGHGRDILNEGSGAFNRAQFMPGITEGQYGPGSLRGASMDEQIQSMAQYIAERYGNPSAALAFHNAHNWYQRGGLAGFQTGGYPQDLFPIIATHGDKLFPPSLRDRFRDTVRKVGRSKRPKVRRVAIDRLLQRVKKLGLPDQLFGQIKELSEKGWRAEEFAQRAGALTDEGKITDTLEAELATRAAEGREFPEADQQEIVERMLGRVDGLTEPEWLRDQLDALFKLRNRLLEAEPIVVAKREQVARLLDGARGRLENLSAEIRAKTRERDQTNDAIEQVRAALQRELDKPEKKRDKGKIKNFREALTRFKSRRKDLNEWLTPRVRQRDALKKKLIPGLSGHREKLNTLRGDLLSGSDDLLGLHDVHGRFAPMNIMGALPEVGVLGGRIFDVQNALEQLLPPRVDTKGEVTDPAAGETADSTQDELLRQLLREANQRTAVSEAQFEVLRNFPPFGGQFGDGGVVPGPIGAPRTIIAHGGETVTAPGDGPDVRVVIEDHRVRVFVDDVEQIVDQKMRRTARAGERRLPGRAGVLA